MLTDFVCLYNYEFWLSLCKIVRSSVILLLPLSKQLFIIIYVNVCVKAFILTKQTISSCSVSEDFRKVNIPSRISILPWPDLSLIEHLWDELGRHVLPRQNPPETLQELRYALVHEWWNNIPQAFIQRSIGSMRRRCEAVDAARGGHTRYWTPEISILHDNFFLFIICSDNDVEKFYWYRLIYYAHIHMNLNFTIFAGFILSM